MDPVATVVASDQLQSASVMHGIPIGLRGGRGHDGESVWGLGVWPCGRHVLRRRTT